MHQKTIKSGVGCKGVGIHKGLDSSLFFRPAKESSGIVFFDGKNYIPAIADNITDTKRGTCLGPISTVEHVLSAVNGLGIDNIIIEVSGDEPPILDGSSIEYVDLLESAGLTEQPGTRNVIAIGSPIEINDGDARMSLFPCDRLIIECEIVFPEPFIGRQTASFDETSQDYKKDISPSRTFGRLSEVESLKKMGLAKGASMQNAVAITENGYSVPLRFPNELARHKILDIIGDIAFAAAKINGRIVSRKAGHKLNIELVRRIINAG